MAGGLHHLGVVQPLLADARHHVQVHRLLGQGEERKEQEQDGEQARDGTVIGRVPPMEISAGGL